MRSLSSGERRLPCIEGVALEEAIVVERPV